MISKAEIKKLSDLARIEIAEDEQEKLAGEMDAILEYVSQVKAVAGKVKENNETGALINVMRADENPNEPEIYSDALIAEFPEADKNYLKVKKIL